MTFTSKAPVIINRLVTDIPKWGAMDASACLGNLGAESGLAAVQEGGQTPPNGGFGWAQWTGPRRTQFFAFCTAHGLDPNSDEGNYQMLLGELRGPYASTVTAVASASGLIAKTAAFEQFYERAGVLRMQTRDQMAQIAYNSWLATGKAVPTPTVAPSVVASAGQMTLSDVQTKLAAMGLYTGAIDGIDGPETAAAVKAFQTANQPLAVDGIAGPATKAALDQAVVT